MKKWIYVLACLLFFSLALVAFSGCEVSPQEPESPSETQAEDTAAPAPDTGKTTTDDSGSPSTPPTDEETTAQDFGLNDISPSDGNADRDNDQNWTDNY